jgi:hypothetical protein
MQTLPDLRKGLRSSNPNVIRILRMSEFDPLSTKHIYVYGFIYLYGGRDCVIGMGTTPRARCSEVRIPAGARNLNLQQQAQDGSGAHTTSCSMGTGHYSHG